MTTTGGGAVDPTIALIEQLRDRALGRNDPSATFVPEHDRQQLWQHLHVAVESADVDALPKPAGRLAGVKRSVLAASGFSWRRQRAVNHALLGAIGELMRELTAAHHSIEQERRRSAAAVAALEAQVLTEQGARERVDASITVLRDQLQAMSARLEDLLPSSGEPIAVLSAAELDELRASLTALADASASHEARFAQQLLTFQGIDRQLHGLGSDVVRLARGDGDVSEAAKLEAAQHAELEAVYARFEDEFRPASEDLTARFREYIADVEHLRGGALPVVDLGCGRGDWLSELRRHDVPAIGVDLNERFAEQAKRAGLDIVVADCLEYLRSAKPESIGAVSAFHLVEHLPQGTVIDLVDAAMRCLAPGGVLILETPNPSNLMVGASAFYRDPTHLRPMNPDYLAFLARDRGFINVQTRFLHPTSVYDAATGDGDNRTYGTMLDDIRWALYGPQDFAVVAYRPPTDH